jgi:hypothetical protein
VKTTILSSAINSSWHVVPAMGYAYALLCAFMMPWSSKCAADVLDKPSAIEKNAELAICAVPSVLLDGACGVLAIPRESSFGRLPGAALPLGQYYSNICYTPITYCYLPARAPVGTPCWCATPYGPSPGYIR